MVDVSGKDDWDNGDGDSDDGESDSDDCRGEAVWEIETVWVSLDVVDGEAVVVVVVMVVVVVEWLVSECRSAIQSRFSLVSSGNVVSLSISLISRLRGRDW